MFIGVVVLPKTGESKLSPPSPYAPRDHVHTQPLSQEHHHGNSRDHSQDGQDYSQRATSRMKATVSRYSCRPQIEQTTHPTTPQ